MSTKIDRLSELAKEDGKRRFFSIAHLIYAALRLQGKPVDMIQLPDAVHVPVKPLERFASEQGDVDWFDFWLNGHDDPDPAKSEQYARWRELRKLQQENEKRATTP